MLNFCSPMPVLVVMEDTTESINPTYHNEPSDELVEEADGLATIPFTYPEE